MMELADGTIYMGGLYESRIVSNVDPNNLNRVRVRVFAIHSDTTADSKLPYAKACHNIFGNDSGDKEPPNIGVIGWVMFEKGDADYPVWMGGQLEKGDTKSGSRSKRIDGDDTLEVKGNKETNVDGDDDRTVEGAQKTTVKKQVEQEYGDLKQTVIDGVVYTHGRREGTVTGDVKETVGGSVLYEILGHRRLTIAESVELSIGGSERRFIVQQLAYKAANATGLPTADAMLFEAINGMLRLSAKSVVGVEGAKLLLDPLGLSTELNSLVNLTVSSGVSMNLTSASIKIGPPNLATVPIATLPHTHLVFGVPSLPVTPGPGAPLSVLGPAI